MKTSKITALCVVALLCLNRSYAQDQNLLNNTGNVGIGTSIPTEKLQVKGNVKIDSALSISRGAEVGDNLTVNGNALIMGEVTANSKLFLPNTLTAPSPKNNSILTIGSDGFVQKSGLDELVGLIYTPMLCAAGPVNPMWSNGPSKLYVKCPDDLKVGVGTTNPRVLLDVPGQFFASNVAIGSVDPTTVTARFHLKHNNSAGNQPIFIVENTTQKLFEVANDGMVRARELKVKLGSWPDYVFHTDYELMPLQEVEAFISLNGHLPNIPKAADVESDGLNLGEMNRLLMEKVEELTLYIIDLQKQVNELKSDNK